MSDFRNRVRNSAYSNVSVHDEDEMDRMTDDYPMPPEDASLVSLPQSAGPHPCALCCFVFSITAIIFLILIGIIFSSDPVFIRNPEEGLSRKEAGNNAYGAAGCYMVTACVSAWYQWGKKYKPEEEYRMLRD
ncbi:hypothetical protein TrCOL_g9871 [Triparma columacea]|uniref:Uncharacterized protein n=1 Tax=Triparma columacea TaxID=722753 RepID=A0A9W7GK18_9STRA|nr:hypothetical protein TrCOL_g9871 [Triparma columacea]